MGLMGQLLLLWWVPVAINIYIYIYNFRHTLYLFGNNLFNFLLRTFC